MASEIGSATFGLVVGLGRFKRELGEAERTAERSGERTGKEFTNESTDEIGKSGGRWSNAIQALRPAIIAGGAALGAAAVIGLMDGLGREAAGDRLAAQLGLDPAEAETAAQIAGDVYAGAWGDSLGEVHDAVGAVMSSFDDLDPAGIETSTQRALDLASAFDLDVARAISSAGILMRSGLARDSEHAFDLITAGMQEMPAHLRDELLQASDEYGKFFSQLGIDGEDAFGMLAEAAQRGPFEIDKVGDALKELTIRSTDMSTASVEAFQTAGLNAEDMAARFLEGGDTAGEAFDELIEGLLSIEDPVERSNAAVALFGTPIEDLGKHEIPEFLEGLQSMETSLGDVSDATDDMGDTLNDNASTEIESFKRQALQGLGEFAVDHAIPAIRALAGWVREDLMPAVSAVAEWASENRPVLLAIASVIGGAVVAAFGVWAVSAAAAAVATLAAIAPILAVGAAIGVLVYLVATHWDTITRVIGGAVEAVTGFISGAIDWVSRNWPLLLGIITGPFGAAVGIIATHWAAIRSGVTGVKNWITQRFDEVVGFFRGLPGRMAAAAGNMWSWIGDTLRGVLQRVANLWNNFRFPSWTMPAVSIPGVGTVGGSTIGGWSLPYIRVPQLAEGGTVMRAGLAVVGERGPELLSMPTGASVTPLDRTMGDGGSSSPEVIQVFLDGRLLAEYVTDYQVDQRARNGRGRRVA